MSCGSSCGGCGGCKALVVIVALLTTATTVATAIGVYMTHYTVEGWMFGTLNGSVAIVAFLVSIMCWLKLVKKLCPCGTMGGACCGSGSCGGCPGCGTSPCSCK